ncbi:MAG: DNA repair protein RecO [Pseudomonadota bacterium]
MMENNQMDTAAILLHRVDYGDYDLIITFFTRAEGKISAMAKSAKRSVKRFGGVLQPFAILNIVCAEGRGKQLPMLQEASFDVPLPNIGTDIMKTAFASYWAEITKEWSEEGKQQIHLYQLLRYALIELDRGGISPPLLSLSFQMKFLSLMGLAPHLASCNDCGKTVDQIKENRIAFDIKTGRLTCNGCRTDTAQKVFLTKGTIRQLQWMDRVPLSQVSRIRCLPQVEKEGQSFLETFLPYHLGKKPKSLTFLEKIR